MKRKPNAQLGALDRCRGKTAVIMNSYPVDHIANMSEISWKLLNHGLMTIADRGSEAVNCLFDNDPRMRLTAVAAIDAAGRKLPLWIVCQGKMMRYEQRYRNDEMLQRAIQDGELV
jgi:hypothetical protein